MGVGKTRNNPCTCGSGRKQKRCCLNKEAVIDQLRTKTARARAKAQEREARFGKVRPIITTDFKGQKIVVVGDRLYFSPKWKNFTDFLWEYMPQIMGKEWWDAQSALQEKERSPIRIWAKGAYEFQQTQAKDEGGGMYSGVPNGPMQAFLTFAYDLYVLRDNKRFQDEIVERLKRREHFPGARYELLVAASFVRGGFDIQYEDETDNTRKHPEFVATHKLTGMAFDVEAKKRNRGTAVTPEQFDQGLARIGVRDLLATAIAKFRDKPLIVFVDLDVPPIQGNPFEKPWAKELLETQTEAGDETPEGKHKCSLVVYTNYPVSYHKDSPPGFSFIVSLSTVPLLPLANSKPIDDLIGALNQFGALPNSFDD